MRALFRELMDLGYEIIHICKMSLSKALVARFGSEEEIDGVLGDGAFHGVKQQYGELSSWRKPWSLVKKEQKAKYMKKMIVLGKLIASVNNCIQEGIADFTILETVQRRVASEVQVP
jgi:hypothetical protein